MSETLPQAGVEVRCGCGILLPAQEAHAGFVDCEWCATGRPSPGGWTNRPGPVNPPWCSQRQVAAAALRWARTHGGWQSSSNSSWRQPSTGATVTILRDLVDTDGTPLVELVIRPAEAGLPVFLPVSSARQAVDLLVVYGLLPSSLAGGYADGYGAGWRAHAPRPAAASSRRRRAELARLVGHAQAALWLPGQEPAQRLAELRRLFETAGHGDPLQEAPRKRLVLGGRP
jgi:hypothetical protein